MDEQNFCKSCTRNKDCQAIYQQLDKIKGSSLVFKAVVAFLLPILVFIVSLAAFEWVFARAIESEVLQTAVSFVLALSVTFALILVIRLINKQFSKNR